jgi:TonB family protein
MRVLKDDSRFILAVVSSVGLHIAIVLLLQSLRPENAEATKEAPVALKVLSKKKLEALRQRQAQDKLSGQVIELQKPEKEEVPEDARFLSQYDVKVQKERKARVRGRGEGGGKGQPKEVAGIQLPKIKEPSKAPAQDIRAKEESQKVKPEEGGEKSIRLGTLGLGALSKVVEGAVGTQGAGRGYGFSGMGVKTGVGGAGSGGASDDAIFGIDEDGETTLVNSRSFKYWDFFQRVKERIRQEWDPVTPYRKRDPTGEVFGRKDRLTILGVVLDSNGSIERLEVLRRSGLGFLDDEALRAFKQAAPFTNPPQGLADENGKIAFRFGFLLEIESSRASFFWQRQ